MLRRSIKYFVVVAAFGLSQAAAASAFTLERPVIKSHGQAERHACFRGAEQRSDGAGAIFDPAPCRLQTPRPERLPVHRGGRVLVRTPEPAERVMARVRSRTGPRTVEAHRIEGSERRWGFRMPRFRNRSRLGITILYGDGHTSWSLPLKRHRHR